MIFSLLFTVLYSNNENCIIHKKIPNEIVQKMIQGNTWKSGCPVGIEDLSYLQIRYNDFNGNIKWGELIVNKSVANKTCKVFDELFNIKYPIRDMRLISEFKGDDWLSIEHDNTSAFNCRKITGNKNKWSNHAYGKAIDINPLENPYISKTGKIGHKKSQKYRNRKHYNLNNPSDRAVLLKNDPTTLIFKKYGWSWGGDWKSIKDYQHFEMKSDKKDILGVLKRLKLNK